MLRTYAPCPCPRPRRFRSTAPVKIKKKLRRPERKLEINLTLSTQPANILLNQGNYTVSIIEGDGIGPEISQAVKDIFMDSWNAYRYVITCSCDASLRPSL